MATRQSNTVALQDTGVITPDIPRSTDSKQSKALAKWTKVDISFNLDTGPRYIMVKDYNINRETAISKKIEAAHRNPLDYQVKGGGHVATLSAGTYELLKPAIIDFNQKDQTVCAADIRHDLDQEDNIVDLNVVVSTKSQSKKLFALKLYNTTSRALINGAKPECF